MVTLFAPCAGHPFSLYYIYGESGTLEEDGAGGLGCVWAATVVIVGCVLRGQHPLALCSWFLVEQRRQANYGERLSHKNL